MADDTKSTPKAKKAAADKPKARPKRRETHSDKVRAVREAKAAGAK